MSATVAALFHCSFCGKSQLEVRALIAAGPQVCICDDCVAVCLDCLWDEHGGRLFAWCSSCGASGWILGGLAPCELCGGVMRRSEPGVCPECGSGVCFDEVAQTCHAPECSPAQETEGK